MFKQEPGVQHLKMFRGRSGAEHIQPKQKWSRSKKFQTPYTSAASCYATNNSGLDWAWIGLKRKSTARKLPTTWTRRKSPQQLISSKQQMQGKAYTKLDVFEASLSRNSCENQPPISINCSSSSHCHVTDPSLLSSRKKTYYFPCSDTKLSI